MQAQELERGVERWRGDRKQWLSWRRNGSAEEGYSEWNELLSASFQLYSTRC